MNLKPSRRRLAWTVGLAAAGALAAGAVAVALPAFAGSAAPSRYLAASDAPSGALGGRTGDKAGGAPAQRSDETPLTGADAEKAKAAALKAVPGATVDRVETDADGAVNEAHLTKTDGSKVTVKFDKDFTVTGVEAGMGTVKNR
jgi:hypothetical protein